MHAPQLLGVASFRDAIQRVTALGYQWDTDHPVPGWLAAAERMVATFEAGKSIGDETKPFDQDEEAIAFAAEVCVPATRLCRLSESLLYAPLLGEAVREEIESLKQARHFYHADAVLFLGMRIATTSGATVRVIQRQARRGGSRPDLEVIEDRVCIECRARGDEGRSPRKDLRDDFNHAGKKFARYLKDKPGWLGVLAVEMGFCGSPTLPDLGRAGPSHASTTEDVRAQFVTRDEVSAFINTWFTIEALPLSGEGYHYEIQPMNASGILYSADCPRRFVALDGSFFQWDDGTLRAAKAPTKKPSFHRLAVCVLSA